MACQYQYKGKTYSESDMLKAIANGEVVLGNINQARQNLRDMLGMQDEDIELVHGLIANQAVGQFQVDGRILLSDMFIQGDEYHEAFHRVFRMMLDDRQRKALLQEYKNREGYKESLKEKRKLYPDKGTDVLIEELLADEFMDYQLANGDYIVPKPIQNFFQRLLNFIRKMLGLQDIEGLYKSIRDGAYKTKPVTGYAKDVAESRLELGNIVLNVEEKNEIVEAITAVMLNKMFDVIAEQGSFDNIDPTPFLLSATEQVAENMFEIDSKILSVEYKKAIFSDLLKLISRETGIRKLNPSSEILKEIGKRLSQLNIKLNVAQAVEVISDDIVPDDGDQDSQRETKKDEDDTDNIGNDYAFMKASWEEDPASKITRSMKLLAASLIDEGVVSRKYKLPTLVPYNKVIYDLMKILKDSPQSWDAVSKVLEANKVSKPWLQKILDRLGSVENVPASAVKVKLRNQFLTSLNKAYYEMYKAVYVEGSLQLQPLDEESLATSQIRDMRSRLGQFGTLEKLLYELKTDSVTKSFEILTGITIPEATLEQTTPKGDKIGNVISGMISTVMINLETNKDLNLVFDKKVDAKGKDVGILGSLRSVLKVLNKYTAGEQGILLNHNNDRVYPFTLPTYQKQIEAAINNAIEAVPFVENARYPMPEGLTPEDVPGLDYVGSSTEMAFQLRVALLNKSIPFFVQDPFNFYQDKNGVYYTNSKLLRQTLMYGAKYNINLFTGMSSTEGVDAKNLLEPDITALIIRSAIPTQGETRYLSVKHGDRGALFAGSFDSKVDYLEGLTTESTIDYLITLLSDELRVVSQSEKYKVFKNMGTGKPRIFDFLNLNVKADSRLTAEQLKVKYKALLRSHIKEQEDDFIKHVQDTYGKLSYEIGDKTIPVYLSAEMFEEVGNTETDPNKLENFLRQTARKYLVHFHEDLRVFTGYIGEYPDMANLFKRIQSLSSSGTPLVNDTDTNNIVIQANNKDEYSIGNKTKTYGDTVLKQQGLIKEKALIGPVVSYTKEEKEQRVQLYKKNLMEYEGFPENIAQQRANEWASAFDNYEEADGVTYTNMFFYREYKQRLGQWTQGQENTLQVELAILNQDSLNPQLYIDNTGTKLSAVQTQEYATPIRVFDLVTDGELDMSVFDTLEPFTMLKPVYSGPVTYKNATVNGIRKTAFHVILPSMAIGTSKIKELHDYMLLNDVDIIPLDSAAKKAFPADAEDIDTTILDTNEDTFSLLRTDYLLEQVAMSNEEKGRIKDATQSTTIMMSNLFNNEGVPKDYNNPVIPFDTLSEEDKLNSSPIYKKIKAYQQARAEVVFDHINRVRDELGINETDKATKIERIKQALLSQVTQPNLIDAVENMDSTIVKYIDLISGSNRLEPVLFSLVSNNAIRIKRPGEMYAQFSVYGMGMSDIKGQRSRRLNDYRLENGVVIPAEVIVPLPKSMVRTLLRMTRSANVTDAIRKYNDGTNKITIKGLRIPNQQLSFNGIYQIKEFSLPTMQNYIILPSEIVPVSSSDFDIDKQQVYWPVLNNMGEVIEDNIYNKLLKAEIDLILTPENFHTLLTPVNEAWLSKDLFTEILKKKGEQQLEGLSGTQLKKALEDITIPLKFKDSGNLAKHIVNGVNMAQSKINVGLVANNAKQYPIGMLDRWESTDEITIMEFNSVTEEPEPVVIKNKIPLTQDVKDFYRLHSNNYRHITESISTFLTAQVDGVKNPYAMKLNIGKNTIGPVMLMVRRQVDPDLAVKIVATPIVIKYSKAKDLYDSVTISAHRLKKQVNEFFLTQSKINELESYKTQARNGTLLVTEQEIDTALKDKTFSTAESLKVLALHRHNELLNREHLRLGVAVTPDTKPMVNRSHLESTQKNMTDLLKNNLIKQNPRVGFLQPAYQAQDLYNSFDSFFYVKDFKTAEELSKVVNGVASRKLGRQNFRARQTVYNDFKAFMFIRKMLKHDRYKEYTFDNLLVKGSVANDILAIKDNPAHRSHNNYFIKNLEIFEGVAPDPVNTNVKLKLLELKGRGSTPMHLADVYDQFQDLDIVLQEKLVAYNIYVTGFGFSKFMLDDAILSDTFNNMASEIGFFTMQATPQDVKDFANIVAALNPNMFYKTSFEDDPVSKYYNNYSYYRKVLSFNRQPVTILGNNYAKRYAGTPEVNKDIPLTSKPVKDQTPEELKNQCKDTPKAEDGMSFGFTPGSEWEVIKDFKGPSHEYGGIDIVVEGGNVKMSNKDGDIKAPDGLVIPSGVTVSDLYKQKTGKDWSTAKSEGLTTGSYADNVKLYQRLASGEFDNKVKPTVNTKPINTPPTKVNTDYTKAKDFNEAFNIARQQLGSNQIFEYQGRKYGTNLKGEKFEPSKEVLAKYNMDQKSTQERLALQNKMVNSLYSNKQTVKLEQEYQDWDKIKKRNQEINKMDQADIIKQYHKNSDQQYLILDKQRGKMHLYRGDKEVASYNVGVGENIGDEQTKTVVRDGKVYWEEGNKMTGAGIYEVSGVTPKNKHYSNAPTWNFKNEQGIEIPMAIHSSFGNRTAKIKNANEADNRLSNGCINGICYDLQELYKKGYNEGQKLYVLPDDKDNTYEISNNKLVFKSKDQNVNRTVNTLNYKPIKVELDEKKFKEKVFTTFDLNDEKEYNNTTKPFVQALADSKQKVMKVAKINGDVYNDIAKIAFGIYGTETNFGDTHSAVGNLARAVNKGLNRSSSSSPDYKAKATTYRINKDSNSVGLTQIRFNMLDQAEKKILNELGITKNEQLLNPKDAAMATVAILASRYHNQLTDEEKRDLDTHLPKKWNIRANYADRVKSNSQYLKIKQLN